MNCIFLNTNFALKLQGTFWKDDVVTFTAHLSVTIKRLTGYKQKLVLAAMLEGNSMTSNMAAKTNHNTLLKNQSVIKYLSKVRILSNFGCKIHFMCSVNFWHQQDSNSLFKLSIGHVTSKWKWPIKPQHLLSWSRYSFEIMVYFFLLVLEWMSWTKTRSKPQHHNIYFHNPYEFLINCLFFLLVHEWMSWKTRSKRPARKIWIQRSAGPKRNSGEFRL